MNGTIREVVILALAAQAGISGDTDAMNRVWPAGSAFPVRQWTRFEEPGVFGRKVIAENPVAWMDFLVAEGVCSITVSSTAREDLNRETRQLVRRGGTWSIHTSDGTTSTTWTPDVTIDSAARNEGRRPIWRVSFVSGDGSSAEIDRDIDGATTELAEVVERARTFTLAQATPHWADIAFDPALETLSGDRDADSEHGQTELTAFVGEPRLYRLLRAAEYAAGIFGGMGSWNDGVGGAADALTRSLYLASERAVLVAVNANDPGC